MSEHNFATVRLIHESKAVVVIPLPTDGTVLTLDAARAISDSVNVLLTAGFVVSDADLLDGERLDVTHIIRGQVTNDGRTNDRVWLYNVNGKAEYGSDMTHYLNTPEDIAAFEQASGLVVKDMPIYKMKAGPVKGSGDFTTFARPTTFSVIRRKEPLKDKVDGVSYKWVIAKYVSTPKPPTTAAPATVTPRMTLDDVQPQLVPPHWTDDAKVVENFTKWGVKVPGISTVARLMQAVNVGNEGEYYEHITDYPGTKIEAMGVTIAYGLGYDAKKISDYTSVMAGFADDKRLEVNEYAQAVATTARERSKIAV